MNFNRHSVFSLLIIFLLGFGGGSVRAAEAIELIDVDGPSFVGLEGGAEERKNFSEMTTNHVASMEAEDPSYDPRAYFHEVDSLLNLCHIQDGLRRHGGDGQRGKVFALQNGLKRTGFYKGELTGDYDKETMLAASQMRMALLKSTLQAQGFDVGPVDGKRNHEAVAKAAELLGFQGQQSYSLATVLHTKSLRTFVAQRNARLLSRVDKPEVVKATKEHSAKQWQQLSTQNQGAVESEDRGLGLYIDDVWRFLNSDRKCTVNIR